MKNLFLLFLSILLSAPVFTQDCFDQYRDQGTQAYENLKFQEAIDLFEAAKICPDNSTEQSAEIEDWLTKARNGYIDAIEKARDEAIKSQQSAVKAQKEAEKQARISEANRLAYLSNQELLKDNMADAFPLAFLAKSMVEDENLPLVQESFGNMVAKKYAKSLSGHSGPITSIRFMGDKILTKSVDHTARLWDLTGNEMTVFKLEEDKLSHFTISSDARQIVTAGKNGILYSFDQNGKQQSTTQIHDRPFSALKFLPNSTLAIAASRDGLVSTWDFKSNRLSKIGEHPANILHMDISTSGNYILTRNSDYSIIVYDVENGKIGEFKSGKHIYTAQFSANEKSVLLSSADGSASLVNLDGTEIQRFKHQLPVYMAKFSNNEEKIVTVSSDHKMTIWSNKGQKLKEFNAHSDKINGLKFSSDNQFMVSYSADGIARIWDTDGTLKAELDQHNDEILNAKFSNASDLIITTSRDNTAKLWSISGNLIMNIKLFNGSVRKAVFSDDDKLIALCSEDGNAIVIQNPLYILEELNSNPPQLSSDQKLKYGLGLSN